MKPFPFHVAHLVRCAMLLAGIAGKLWLIHGMEITDDPDDATSYLAQILGNWGSYFGPGAAGLSLVPGYALFLVRPFLHGGPTDQQPVHGFA